MDAKVKIGIVGIGGYGRLLLDLLLEEQMQEVARVDVAVVRSPERAVEHLNVLKAHSPDVKIFQTLEEAVESGVELDLMMLPVGIDSHRDMTEMALKAGWNVMVEKPLAGSVEEAEAMVGSAEASGRFVAVGFQDMYGPWAPAMKAALLSGSIGSVRSVRVLGIWGRSVDYYCRNSWAGKLIVDGRAIYDSPFNNGMAHYLNLALFLAGSDSESVAVPISVDGSLWRAHDIESCDTACLRWKTKDGPDVSVFFSHAAASDIHPELVVQGTEGVLHWKFESHWELRAHGVEPVRYDVASGQELRQSLLRQVVEKINQPDTSVFTPRQALAQVKAVALAHDQVAIQSFPESLVQSCEAVNEFGLVSEMLTVNGLEAAGLRFFEEGSLLSDPEEWSALETANSVC